MRCDKRRLKSAISFGIGLLTASLLPTKWVLIVAAAALVIVGVTCVRR